LKPIFKAYNIVRSSDENWAVLYKEANKLALENNSEIDINKKDISFCVYFILEILLAVKHDTELFSDIFDSSEWDYIVKFWESITQRLFRFSGLHLKWGNIH
jgi:hypothetical protein